MTVISANPLARVDGEVKVRGEARFTAEFKIENMAHAALVYSTIAKGKIRKIDTGQREAEPGVLAVITHENMTRMKAPPHRGFPQHRQGLRPERSSHHAERSKCIGTANQWRSWSPKHWSRRNMPHRWSRWSMTPRCRIFRLRALKPKAVVPQDIMGEPPEIKIGDAEKAHRGGG